MSIDWQAMIGPDVPVVETFIRGTLVYFFLLLMMRLSKREAGELGLADVLVIVVLADASQNAMAGEYNSILSGVLLVATIIFWDFVIDWATYHFPVLDKWGKPQRVCLIKNGRIQTKGLRSEMITRDELMAQLRIAGVDEIKKVKHAMMEANGKISVVKYKD